MEKSAAVIGDPSSYTPQPSTLPSLTFGNVDSIPSGRLIANACACESPTIASVADVAGAIVGPGASVVDRCRVAAASAAAPVDGRRAGSMVDGADAVVRRSASRTAVVAAALERVERFDARVEHGEQPSTSAPPATGASQLAFGVRLLHQLPIAPSRTGVSRKRYDASVTKTVTVIASTNRDTDPSVAPKITKIGQRHRYSP